MTGVWSMRFTFVLLQTERTIGFTELWHIFYNFSTVWRSVALISVVHNCFQRLLGWIMWDVVQHWAVISFLFIIAFYQQISRNCNVFSHKISDLFAWSTWLRNHSMAVSSKSAKTKCLLTTCFNSILTHNGLGYRHMKYFLKKNTSPSIKQVLKC